MTFASSETGAVTVDWVVLTAALAGLGLAAMSVVSAGVESNASAIEDHLSRTDMISTAFEKIPRDAWRDALIATCTHSTGWACDGAEWYDTAVSELEGLDKAEIETALAGYIASRDQHQEKIGELATMVENWDPDAQNYEVFQGLWTTWTTPQYVEQQMALHSGGDPAAYAIYLENQVELLHQTARAYDEELATRPPA